MSITLSIDSYRGFLSGKQRKHVNNRNFLFDNPQSLEIGNKAPGGRGNRVWGEVPDISWHFILLIVRLILSF